MGTPETNLGKRHQVPFVETGGFLRSPTDAPLLVGQCGGSTAGLGAEPCATADWTFPQGFSSLGSWEVVPVSSQAI